MTDRERELDKKIHCSLFLESVRDSGWNVAQPSAVHNPEPAGPKVLPALANCQHFIFGPSSKITHSFSSTRGEAGVRVVDSPGVERSGWKEKGPRGKHPVLSEVLCSDPDMATKLLTPAEWLAFSSQWQAWPR